MAYVLVLAGISIQLLDLSTMRNLSSRSSNSASCASDQDSSTTQVPELLLVKRISRHALLID